MGIRVTRPASACTAHAASMLWVCCGCVVWVRRGSAARVPRVLHAYPMDTLLCRGYAMAWACPGLGGTIRGVRLPRGTNWNSHLDYLLLPGAPWCCLVLNWCCLRLPWAPWCPCVPPSAPTVGGESHNANLWLAGYSCESRSRSNHCGLIGPGRKELGDLAGYHCWN